MLSICSSVCLFACLSVCLSPKCKKKRDFLKKLSNLELWFLLTTYRKSYMIPSYVSHCRVLPPGEFNSMSSQSHVSHCTVLPLGEFTVMIPEPHATLQGVRIPFVILKIVFRHILFFCFLKCSLCFNERRLSCRL